MQDKRYIFGKWQETNTPLTINDVQSICQQAEGYRKEFANYPLDKIFTILDKLKEIWIDPNYPGRVKLLEILPNTTGFSKPMVEMGLNAISFLLDRQQLQQKLKTELASVPRSNDYTINWSDKTLLRWYPLGTILHIISGNVFLAGLGSLIEGLLSGNMTILKMSSSEKVFLPELIKSLELVDAEGAILKSIAIIDYDSSQTEVINEFKQRVDGVVVWGGEEAVRAYQQDLPARTKLIIFGPKLSLSIVTKSGIEEYGINTIAENLAAEICLWDQNACTAPQVCYVEGEENTKKLLNELSIALNTQNNSLPPGQIDLNAAVEIRKIRSIFEMAQAKKQGALSESKNNLDWTVYIDKEPSIIPSPLHRTLKLIPFDNLDIIFQQLKPLRGYIQTIGLSSSRKQFLDLANSLALEGALKIVEIGQMAKGPLNDPHDGAYDLPQLMKLVTTRNHNLSYKPQACVNSRLRNLISHASKSPYYHHILANKIIETTDDLIQLPILTRELMEENIASNKLNTAPAIGGYVSRSGGSSGKPKYSIYNQEDWEHMMSEAVQIFYALGLRRGDRLANCLLAGDLYGSFVSFDHINYRLGIMTFAFAGNVNEDVFIDTWQKFNINAIQGVPASIVPMLKNIKKKIHQFTLEKVIYAGSPLSLTDYQWLKEELMVKRIASVIGANDGGQMAYQCQHMKGSIHHTIDDFNYIEIVDNNGNRLPNGEAGNILITSLLKFSYPLIRYQIGDRGRILDQVCPCGNPGRILEYLGRADNVITVGMLNIDTNDIFQTVETFPVGQCQIIIKSTDQGEYLQLNLESETGDQDLSNSILASIYQKIPKIQERIREQKLLPIVINVFSPGEIERNQRTGKLKGIIDERN